MCFLSAGLAGARQLQQDASPPSPSTTFASVYDLVTSMPDLSILSSMLNGLGLVDVLGPSFNGTL